MGRDRMRYQNREMRKRNAPNISPFKHEDECIKESVLDGTQLTM
jgi:hypothetical protein